MNIKKERLHRCGLSNIDFRTKRDGDSLKVHQPWKIAAPFGTMGYSGYRPDPIQRKTLLKVTENINNQRTLASDIPDAKYYKTAEFYNKNKIPLKTKAFFTNERIAQLDESFKGKEKYTGDSMMIADVLKFRKRKAKKKLHDSDKELRSKTTHFTFSDQTEYDHQRQKRQKQRSHTGNPTGQH